MSQHYAITMPQLSDTMTEGVVVTWEKQPGDKVELMQTRPLSKTKRWRVIRVTETAKVALGAAE